MNLLQKLKQRTQRKLSYLTLPSKSSDTKWATFTYTTPQIRKITNIFKQTNVKIAYKTNNTILQLTKPTNTPIPPHANSEIYALTCNTVHASRYMYVKLAGA